MIDDIGYNCGHSMQTHIQMENRLNEFSKLLENKCGAVQMNDWQLGKQPNIDQSGRGECRGETKNDLGNIRVS